ncbi:MAG: hypothetical protein Q8W51_14200 [Candidatus Palauibacterales bacterium]|nr:hypothetical protein [Candidatus Palauibacterales bacterium]MDP2530875.1 hypothetical protein [Candidatus Palauibacterales bacterium]MDP2582802.1 hypothetical protein [Candidatus Palauibacterales bacterium]
MKHSRMVFTAVAACAFLLVACGEEARPGGDGNKEGGGQPSYLGTDSTCHKEPKGKPTRPIVEITVTGDSIHLDPDPIRATVGVGFVGWRSSKRDGGYGWEVTYKGESPLPERTYRSDDGNLDGGVVRKDAACTLYPYSVKVWQPGGKDTLTLDPGTDVLPG